MKDDTKLKRKKYDELLKWKKSRDGATAILIEGAHRVGKSTIAKEFAENEYDSYCLIDFNEAPQMIKDLFVNERDDLNTIFNTIETYYKVKLIPRKSVIIFDEVQLWPPARSLIKYLVADGRYDYGKLCIAEIRPAHQGCEGGRGFDIFAAIYGWATVKKPPALEVPICKTPHDHETIYH